LTKPVVSPRPYVRVLERNHAVEELHERDLDPVGVHEVGELDADGPRPRDDDAGGQAILQDLRLVGHDALGELRPREQPA
jgi:hypothetical protein